MDATKAPDAPDAPDAPYAPDAPDAPDTPFPSPLDVDYEALFVHVPLNWRFIMPESAIDYLPKEMHINRELRNALYLPQCLGLTRS